MRGTQPRGGALRRLAALEAAIQPGGEQRPAVMIVRVQPGLIEELTGPGYVPWVGLTIRPELWDALDGVQVGAWPGV